MTQNQGDALDPRRVRALFDRARELPPDRRGRFLAEASGTDGALRREVASLLHAYARAQSFLGPTVAEPEGQAPVPAGTRIGDWVVRGTLGRGGGGLVYRVESLRDSRPAALKTVRAPRQALVGSIRREIRALARISHPQIVRILDHGAQGGLPWYAMELVEGRSLRESVGEGREKGRLARGLTLVRQLCVPLAYLHGEGIVHRDLKPANVLVRPDGTPVLVDFGLMQHWSGRAGRDPLELRGDIAGTVAYMAPEQARGERVDARADLYSLGCILYELVTGRRPFRADSTSALLRMHQEEPPAPPSSVVPGLPSALDSLLLRILAKAPRDRIGYAEDIALALEELGAGGLTGDPGPRARPYLYAAALAGRSGPLSRLRGFLSKQDNGEGAILLLGGESGVGKTRFVGELAAEARRRERTVLAGECTAEAAGEPLYALRRPLQAIADRCIEAGEEATRALLGRRGPVLAPYQPALAGLPGLALAPEPVELPPREARLRLWRYLLETLTALAAPGRVLLVLDDLHWSDDLTLGWLEYLSRSGKARSSGLFIVGTYRSEEITDPLSDLLSCGRVQSCLLGRLGDRAVGEMVADMLALPDPPASFVRYLARQSEGNPLFVAEYLRTALDEGLLARDTLGRFAPAASEGKPAEVPLPGTVQEIILRRLAALPEDARSLLEVASVLGREVEIGVLSVASDLEEDRRLDAAPLLVARQVLEEVPDDRLRFNHDGIREVTYRRMHPERRARLHRRAAEALETHPSREDRMAEIGRHWEYAGEAARARPCYLAAARRALSSYAHDEAERLYRTYLRLVDGPGPESVAARNELGGRLLAPHGRTTEAVEQLHRALAEARLIGDRRGEAAGLDALGRVALNDPGMKEAGRDLEQALSVYRELGDRQAEGLVLIHIGVARHRTGRTDAARERFQEAERIARALGDPVGIARALRSLALAELDYGRAERARSLLRRALAQLGPDEDPRLQASLLANMASIQDALGDMARAFDLNREALRMHREMGNRIQEGLVLNNIGVFHLGRGRMKEAEETLHEALAIHRETGNRWDEGTTLANLADLENERHGIRRARATYSQAIEIQRVVGDRLREASTHCMFGDALRRACEPGPAREAFDRSLGFAEPAGVAVTGGLALVGLALLDRDAGELIRARSRIGSAMEWLGQDRSGTAPALAACASARIERTSGNPDEAGEILERVQAFLLGASDLRDAAAWTLEAGHVSLAMGEDARPHLRGAERLMKPFVAGDEAPLAKETKALRDAVEAAERGDPLWRGEVPSALPARLRRLAAEEDPG